MPRRYGGRQAVRFVLRVAAAVRTLRWRAQPASAIGALSSRAMPSGSKKARNDRPRGAGRGRAVLDASFVEEPRRSSRSARVGAAKLR